MSESLSRQLAGWAAELRFTDLPAEVVDRAKGVTLQGLGSALLGSATPDGDTALRLMQAEEAGGAGLATVLVDGARLTRGGAAFVNAELILAGGKWDTFRMLTHPGSAILPAALALAESVGASGREYLVAVAAGYEIMERLAADFIPSVMARGFHAGPVFGIFGAAVAASKLIGLSADQTHGAIAQCVNLAAGNLEGARSGGRSVREGAAVRNALLAVALAQHGAPGGETVLEGEAGFYHAYSGNNLGRLTYSFSGATSTALEDIVAGLGERWMFLETLYRIYSTPGYNIAHVAVTSALCAEHDIHAAEVDRVEAVVNWLETQYPSPAFPSPDRTGVSVASPHYFVAYGVVFRGYPLLHSGEHPPQVLDLMQRVTLIPSHAQPLFAPRVTVYLRDGRSFSRQAGGREFVWNFAEEARRIREITPGVPIPSSQFEELISACGRLDELAQADDVVRLTLRERRGASFSG
ncbi:MAG: MmgE/PrpD family protein [Chloroflexi bacterium]|nr:MmgE/PrpD family protein [Chloroflexota bacterium]MBV9600736.1 MmgE/PrpD family protein [Chloroflexota bacterium]